MIPAQAVEAAVEALRTPTPPYKAEGVLTWEQIALTVLEAAAPHILALVETNADELAAEYRRGYRDGLVDRKQVTAATSRSGLCE